MSNETLLPCPFCGEVPELPEGVGTQYEMYCACGMAQSCVQICDLMTLEERLTGWIDEASNYADQYVERARVECIKNWNRRADRIERAAQGGEERRDADLSLAFIRIGEAVNKWRTGLDDATTAMGNVKTIVDGVRTQEPRR